MTLAKFKATIAGKADLVAYWREMALAAYELIQYEMDKKKLGTETSEDRVIMARTAFAIAKANLASNAFFEHNLRLPLFNEWDLMRLEEGIRAA